jgi:hypothetical protein
LSISVRQTVIVDNNRMFYFAYTAAQGAIDSEMTALLDQILATVEVG